MLQTIMAIFIVIGALAGLSFFAFSRKNTSDGGCSCGCSQKESIDKGTSGCGCTN